MLSAFFLLVAGATLHSASSIWFPRPLWSAPRVSSFFRVYSWLSSTPPRCLPRRLLLRQPRRAVKLSAFFLLAARLTLHSASSIWFPRPGWPRSTRLIFFPCFLLTLPLSPLRLLFSLHISQPRPPSKPRRVPNYFPSRQSQHEGRALGGQRIFDRLNSCSRWLCFELRHERL